MKQLDIEYFFPLTEQISLDLDYTQCTAHQYWVRAKGIAGVHGPFSTGMQYVSNVAPNTIEFHPSPDSAGYWKVGEGLQMHNKKKPSWLHQQMTKFFFGWKWKDK